MGFKLHGANGQLIDQFLRDSQNKRTDGYGAIDEFINVFEKGRIDFKISFIGRSGVQCDSGPLKLYKYLIQELEKKKIAFIEVRNDNVPANQFDFGNPSSKDQIHDLFEVFRDTPDTAIEGIENRRFDDVTFGRLYISNSDLVERILQGYELKINWDIHTFYTKGVKGYLDYSLYSQQQK